MTERTFYDDWLAHWEESERKRRASRLVIHEDELAWVETEQDARAALLIAPQTGFSTYGSVSMLSEIPPGHHSGKRKHGEEVVFILAGTGFSVVDGVRYDWRPGTMVAIAFGHVHQHFNTGDDTVRYISVLSPYLEHFAGLSRFTQYESHGPTTGLPDVPVSSDGLGRDRRVAMHRDDVVPFVAQAAHAEMPRYDSDKPLVVGNLDGMSKLGMHHAGSIRFMRVGKDTNDFKVHLQEISSITQDPPHEANGKHSHMEASLYVLQGEGYSVIDGQQVPWRAGSAFHITGPQTVHQHFSTSDEMTEMLRIAPGLRYFFEKAAGEEFPYVAYEPRQAVNDVFSRERAEAEAST